jgi:hypothetical protein
MKFIFLLILTTIILYMANFIKIKSNMNNTPMSESLFQGEFETFHIGEINNINKEEELNKKSNAAKNRIKPGRISQDTLEDYLEKTNNNKSNSTNISNSTNSTNISHISNSTKETNSTNASGITNISNSNKNTNNSNSTHKTIELGNKVSNYTDNIVNVIKIPAHSPTYKNMN